MDEISMTSRSKVCLSYWFPKLLELGISVPETYVCSIPRELMLAKPLCGETFTEEEQRLVDGLIADLTVAAERIGFPVFLRSGWTSHKHGWKDSCYVERADQIRSHVMNIVEFSEMVDVLGLPTSVWVVRKMLEPITFFHAFNGMPVNLEVRLFAGPHGLYCYHPYWPKEALESRSAQPDNENWESLFEILRIKCVERGPELFDDSVKIAQALGGDWSIDWLLTKEDKWYCTDMAPAAISYHWPGCDMAARWEKKV